MTIHCVLLLLISAGDAPAEIPIEGVQVTLIEQVEVPAQEAGIIASIRIREGQMVAHGELLARIDDTETQIQQKRAEIELSHARKLAENDIAIRFAEKSREVSEAELKRATDSLARYPKSISRTEIDRLHLQAEKSALGVEQARFDHAAAQFAQQLREAELELAANAVRRRQITAPLAGVVVEVNRQPGEWVESSQSVLRILRLDRLRAEGFLHVDQMRDDLVGCPVALKAKLPGKSDETTFTGKLMFVSPEISPVNGQMRIWAEIENQELLLRPGLRGTMILQPGDGEKWLSD